MEEIQDQERETIVVVAAVALVSAATVGIGVGAYKGVKAIGNRRIARRKDKKIITDGLNNRPVINV